MRLGQLVGLVPAVAALLVLPSCGKACTQIGVADGIGIAVPPDILAMLHTVRTTACVDGDCTELTGPAMPEPTAEPSPAIQRVGERSIQAWWDVPSSWEDQDVTMEFEGLDRQGRPVLRTVEMFRFEAIYPNGEDCDKEPGLVHSTSVSRSDLLG